MHAADAASIGRTGTADAKLVDHARKNAGTAGRLSICTRESRAGVLALTLRMPSPSPLRGAPPSPAMQERGMSSTVTIEFEGQPIAARRGESVAAALTAAGVRGLRTTRSGAARGVCKAGHSVWRGVSEVRRSST